MKLFWSPLALERLTEIAAFIAQDDLLTAEKWIEKIFTAVGRLRQFPDSGRVVPEIGMNEFREVIFGNYRIIYRKEVEMVAILTVRHGKQVLPVDDI